MTSITSGPSSPLDTRYGPYAFSRYQGRRAGGLERVRLESDRASWLPANTAGGPTCPP